MVKQDLEKIKKRILDIAFKKKLSHLGSYFSSLEIIYEIFCKMKDKDIFILSSGHAALAYYCVLEHFKRVDAEYLFEKHGGHPHRDEENFIYCSTGSLGLGITIATGRAFYNKDIQVYCLISDGECAEGSVWESLRFIKESNMSNIHIYVNMNGYCAYDVIDTKYLENRLKSFLPDINIRNTDVNQFPFLNGMNAHYHVMSESDYKTAIETL
jgi:transketolase